MPDLKKENVAKYKTEDAICMPIGWPETWSKGAEGVFQWFHKQGVIKDLYFKVGHAGMCLIDKKTGGIQYFDFGRYTCDHGQGRVRGGNTDPNLTINVRARFDAEGNISNLEELVQYLFSISKYTHGEGEIYFSLYPKMNLARTLAFIHDLQEQGSVRYTTFAPNSTNCSRFVLGALLAGSTSSRDKTKFVLTPTLRASPVGTSVDAGYISGVFRQKSADSPLEHFSMSRWDNLKLIFNNIKGNFVGEKVVREDLLKAQERPEVVDESAVWLGGLGEGNWIHLTPWDKGEGLFRARAHYHDGDLNYDTLVQDALHQFDPDRDYTITYDCNRLFITVAQQGQKIRLRLVRDFEGKPQSATRKKQEKQQATQPERP